MNEKLTLDDYGSFTWNFANKFFIETKKGNFIWSCPEYPEGNNTITPFKGTYKEWAKVECYGMGRDKGTHKIRNYCGEGVEILST